MPRLTLACLLILAGLGPLAVPQETPVVFGDPNIGAIPAVGNDGAVVFFADDTDALRRRLIEIATDKAASMSADELRRAIVQLEFENSKLPPAAVEIMESYRDRASAVQKEANRKIRGFRKETIDDLKLVQDQYLKQGMLDEAVATRDLIRALKTPPFAVRPDPGSMSTFQNQLGKVFYFKVNGSVGGPLWGTKIYTSDSNLASAAVHAGVLKNGETGVVKVTMLPGRNSYTGANANGASSSSYGQYPASYRVEAVELD